MTHNLENQIFQERKRLLYSAGPAASFLVIAFSTFLYLIFLNAVPEDMLNIWLAYIVFASILRMTVVLIEKNSTTLLSEKQWVLAYGIGTFLISLGWGWMAFIAFGYGHLYDMVILLFLMGVSSLAIPVLISFPIILIIYFLPSMMIVAVSFILSTNETYPLIGSSVITYVVVIVISALKFHGILINNIKLRFENEIEVAKRKETENELRKHQSNLEDVIARRTLDLEVAREEAIWANNEKSRFLANMSHELRTPMHAIMSFTHLARKLCKDDSKKQINYLDKATTSAKRLTQLLNDLLDLSKIEAGKMNIEKDWHDISEVIQGAINEVESLLMKKNLQLSMSVTKGDAIPVNFDPKLITQVMVNLLSNAIKFSEQHSTIHISIAYDIEVPDNLFPGAVEVIVSDQGPGIPNNELEMIFDKFIQSSVHKSSAGGTGLGLPICREIISMHNGLIWAESPVTEHGNGTAFHFVLPKM